MATVYLAEDLKHDRRVALKVLKPELAAVLGAVFSNGKAEVASVPPATAVPQWDIGPDNSVYWWMTQQRRKSVLVANWAREVDSLVRAPNGAKP